MNIYSLTYKILRIGHTVPPSTVSGGHPSFSQEPFHRIVPYWRFHQASIRSSNGIIITKCICEVGSCQARLSSAPTATDRIGAWPNHQEIQPKCSVHGEATWVDGRSRQRNPLLHHHSHQVRQSGTREPSPETLKRGDRRLQQEVAVLLYTTPIGRG